MDLSNFDTKSFANEGKWLHIMSPAGEPLFADDLDQEKPMRIKLLGADSDAFQRHAKRMGASATNKALSSSKNTERAVYDMLVACTRGIENIILNGEELEHTPENVRMLFEDYPWITDQVFEFIRDRAQYLGD